MEIQNTSRIIKYLYNTRVEIDKRRMAYGALYKVKGSYPITIKTSDNDVNNYLSRELQQILDWELSDINDYFKLDGIVSSYDFMNDDYFKAIGTDFYKNYSDIIYPIKLNSGSPVYVKSVGDKTAIGLPNSDMIVLGCHYGKRDLYLAPFYKNEMDKCIAEISKIGGKVLIVGDPFGYAAYKLSKVSTVKKVSIYEKEPRIVSFLNDNVVPHSKNTKVISRFTDSAYDAILVYPSSINEYFSMVNKWKDHKNIYYMFEDHGNIQSSVIFLQYCYAKLGNEDAQEIFKKIAPDIWYKFESISDKIERPDQIEYYLENMKGVI